MQPLGISINGLARELHVPVTRISQIVNERRGITADTALRLARHFASPAADGCRMTYATGLRTFL